MGVDVPDFHPFFLVLLEFSDERAVALDTVARPGAAGQEGDTYAQIDGIGVSG